jgi:hypothetical protein
VRQLANTLTIREFSKWIVELDQMSMIFNTYTVWSFSVF